MAKVIVSGDINTSKGKRARNDIQIFSVDLTPTEIREILEERSKNNPEEKIAKVKMNRFRKDGTR